MNYTFDRCPRFWKEMPKLDDDISKWDASKFFLMKELMELADRFGNRFDCGYEELASHTRTTRRTISPQMKELEREGWINIRRGKFRGFKSTIIVNWDKIDRLYKKHEVSLGNMEKKSKRVRSFDALKNKSVQSLHPLKDESVQSMYGKREIDVMKACNNCPTIRRNNKNDNKNGLENEKIPTEGNEGSTLKEGFSIKEAFYKEIGRIGAEKGTSNEQTTT